jgi:hypothetical protein
MQSEEAMRLNSFMNGLLPDLLKSRRPGMDPLPRRRGGPRETVFLPGIVPFRADLCNGKAQQTTPGAVPWGNIVARHAENFD